MDKAMQIYQKNPQKTMFNKYHKQILL